MKRITTVLALLVLVASILTGCQTKKDNLAETTSVSSKTEDSNEKEKISVITTIFPQYDFVRQIAGEHVELTMLLPPGAESHSYDPSPQDIIKIQDCDLFIYVGGQNDAWIESILNNMGDNKPQTLKLIDCVFVVEEEIVEGMQHSHDKEEDHTHAHDEEDDHTHEHDDDHFHENEEKVIDEHVWTSPQNAITIVEKITDVLNQLDEKNKAIYTTNSQHYIKDLEELDNAFKEVVENASRTTIIFGDRFPFRYFTDAYGLTYYAAFSGCSTDSAASASTIAFLIDKVREEQIPVVFYLELSNQRIAGTISEDTGATTQLFHSSHNVTKNEFESGITYLGVMTQNVEALKAALQ